MPNDDVDDRATPGTIKAAPIVKAGCGLRFDPDRLSEETGFDFSGAKKLKMELEQMERKETESQSKKK